MKIIKCFQVFARDVIRSKGLSMSTSSLCLGLLLPVINWPVFAASGVLDLPTAQAIALTENPGIAEMQARYEALQEVVPQQGSLPDPVVSFGAMNFPWDEFDRNQEPMTQLQVGVSQALPFPGKLNLREDIALLEATAASHSLAEMRLNLSKNVSMAWWELYFLDRSLDTVFKNITLLRQFVDIAATKYEVGKGLQQDVLLAQLELSKALDNEIRIKAMRDRTRIRLNLLMGRAPEILVALPGEMSEPAQPINDEVLLYQRAEQARPLLAQGKTFIDASAQRLELAKKDYYPDFKVGVSYGNRDEDQMGRSRQDFLSVMLSVSIPLYARTKQDRAVQQRTLEVARSRYALTDTKNMVRSSIAEALSDYRRASEQETLFDEGIVPQARQTVASMTAGYQVDKVDFLNLVRSQISLFNYELQYWKSYTEANQALARLQAAVGEESIYE
jgi:outer membrane protein TolC